MPLLIALSERFFMNVGEEIVNFGYPFQNGQESKLKEHVIIIIILVRTGKC